MLVDVKMGNVRDMSKKDYDIKIKHKIGIKVPDEVIEVCLIYAASGGIVGSKTFERVQEIIDKHPKWFPWEHKYKSIPEEVHKAYRKEQLGFDISDLGAWKDKEPSRGLLQMIEESARLVEFTIEDKPVQTLLDETWEEVKKVSLMKIENDKKEKALWDKHYKKYNLAWRK